MSEPTATTTISKSELETFRSIDLRGPQGNVLNDFNETQWWVAELESAVRKGTDEQKRAMGVLHNLLDTLKCVLGK